MSLSSQKSGNAFKGIAPGYGKKLSPEEWGELMLAAGFPKKVKVIAEGLGVLEAESGFDPTNSGDGIHIGAWAEEESFGSRADRLDPVKSTQSAYKRWKADGESFWPAWGNWERGETEGAGPDRAAKFMKAAQAAIGRDNSGGSGGLLGTAGNAVDDVVGGITSAEDFLVELAKTVLDYKKLGQLAAEAVSWFVRLIAKAIWDYVIAPLIHWSERAVSFYWTNFFSTGTEKGSGIGYQLRQNAGIITIVFWSMGYAILWTDGTSLSPADAQGSVLGQGVKKIDGAIARRNLIKPKDVEEKTPDKPEPKTSTVTIERTNSFSVSRNRPVKVASSGGEHSTGRKNNERDKGQRVGKIARPGESQVEQVPDQKIIIPPGAARPPKAKAKDAAKQSGPGEGTRRDSADRAKDASVIGG